MTGKRVSKHCNITVEIILNPKYSHLHDFLAHLEEHYQKGEIVQDDFNEIRILEVDGLKLSVKKYGQSMRHRLKFYKMAKGKKAYIGQRLLRERGYESPEPVAFVRYRRRMLTSRTYFITVQSPLRHTLSDLPTLPQEEQKAVVRAFAAYAARFHEDGFIHRNLKTKHVLFDKMGDGYTFALLDANRVHKGRRVDVEKGCANFSRLDCSDENLKILLNEYADVRHADKAACYNTFAQSHEKYRNKILRRGH